MTTFPLNPTNGLTHSINDRVWSWNGYAWEKTNQSGGGGTGPAGPTGPTGPTGANGIDTYGIEYDFDTSTTASDPGSGEFRFSIDWTVGTIGNTYNAYVSETDNNGVGIGPLLDTLTDSSNTNKALIVLYKKGTPSVNAKFYVTGQTDNGSWRTLDIKYIDRDSFGTVGNGDEMMMTISIIGDQGTKGETGPAGADGAGGGGATLAAGDGLTLSPVVAGVGYTMSVDFNGAATNQVLYHDGTGFSGDNSVLFAQDANYPHLEADIEGKLLKAIKADEALAAFDPVYITGNVGASDRVTVAKADASDSAKMPAAGIVTDSFSTNDEGYMVVTGLVRDADTSGFTANDTAYVGVGGGITAARPSGATDLIQNLGRVGRVHASTGTLLVLGAGRANDTPNLIHARAGISMDALGITFPDGTFQSSAASGSGVTAGAGMVLTGSTLGIDPTAVVHVAGISSDGGITASGRVFGESVSVDGHLLVKDGSQLQIKPSGFLVSAIDGNGIFTFGRYYATSYVQSGSYVHAGTGVSLDAGGITFPDGTFQSSAASAGGTGYIAGDGLTLDVAGGTFSIDPTAAIHVAGVSSDGGITAGGAVVESNAEFRDPTGFGIKKVSGALRLTYGNGAGDYAATVNSSSFGVYEPFICTQTGEFREKLWLYKGISMDAGGITFPDGTFQSTAPSASSGGSEFVSSHNILLEFPDNKEYSLDGYTVAARTYNIFYGRSATGGCTADLIVGGTTLASIAVGPTGASATFSTVVAKESEISVVIIGVTTGTYLHDVRLVAGYTQ